MCNGHSVKKHASEIASQNTGGAGKKPVGGGGGKMKHSTGKNKKDIKLGGNREKWGRKKRGTEGVKDLLGVRCGGYKKRLREGLNR